MNHTLEYHRRKKAYYRVFTSLTINFCFPVQTISHRLQAWDIPENCPPVFGGGSCTGRGLHQQSLSPPGGLQKRGASDPL